VVKEFGKAVLFFILGMGSSKIADSFKVAD